MGATQFKRAELEDQEIISHYFEHHTSRSCERTFANVYLWSRQYPVKWAIIKNALVFKSEDENHVSCAYPAGAPEDVKNALEERMPVKHIVILDTAGVSSMYANDGGVIVAV